MQNEAVKTWHVWKVPDWELNIISPYLRTFHRKKYQGWIPFNPDFRCPNERKEIYLRVLTFAITVTKHNLSVRRWWVQGRLREPHVDPSIDPLL